MKCPDCTIVEMKVKRRKADELLFECPNCGKTEQKNIKELIEEDSNDG